MEITQLEENQTTPILIESNSMFMFSIKSNILRQECLTIEEKENIINNLPDTKKTIDAISFIKALGYGDYNKSPRYIPIEKMQAITPDGLISFIYLNALGINMQKVYYEWEFNEPLSNVVPLVKILNNKGISLENALGFHPELFSMNSYECQEYLDEQQTQPVLKPETIKILNESQIEDNKKYSPEIQSLLFFELLNTQKSLKSENELQPIRNKLISLIAQHNEGLVTSISRKLLGKESEPEDYEDACSFGRKGLLIAIAKFDPRKGYKFSTYATWWIRQKVLIEFRGKMREVSISQNLQLLIRKFNTTQNELIQERKTQSISQEDVLEALAKKGIEIKDLPNFKEALSASNLIEIPWKGVLDEMLPEDSEHVETQLLKKERREEIELMLSNILTPKEVYFILQRYPLDQNIKPKTQDELAKILGVTRARAGQVEEAILTKLKSHPEIAE